MPERGDGQATFRERVTLLSHEDRLRVRFTLQHGEPVEIMVQLESWVGGSWVPVRPMTPATASCTFI
jgi:hypothetical protein